MSAIGTNTKNARKSMYGMVQFLLRPKNDKTFRCTIFGI